MAGRSGEKIGKYGRDLLAYHKHFKRLVKNLGKERHSWEKRPDIHAVLLSRLPAGDPVREIIPCR